MDQQSSLLDNNRKFHVITIENKTDDKYYNVSLFNNNHGLKISYYDTEGNNDYDKFISDFRGKDEKILNVTKQVHCEYSKFVRKQLDQPIRLKSKTFCSIIPMKMDPYQYQGNMISIDVSHCDFNFKDEELDISFNHLMPDTTIMAIISTLKQ